LCYAFLGFRLRLMQSTSEFLIGVICFSIKVIWIQGVGWGSG
jgi:hypothetical protein